MITQIFHTGFTVTDLEQSVAFYRDLLGMEVYERREPKGEGIETLLGIPNVHSKVAFLRVNGVTFELTQYLSPPGKNVDKTVNNIGTAHLALHSDDVAGDYQRLKQAGVKMKGPVYTAKSGRRGFGFYDPDGYTVELLDPM